MKRIVTVVGSRPQYVKAILVSRELAARGIGETVVHTWQHYDYEMTNRVLEGINIGLPQNSYRALLDNEKMPEARQFVIRLKELEKCDKETEVAHYVRRIKAVVSGEKPDCVLIYGDTNSTLAGARAGAEEKIPVAHVEAGMRSFDLSMPEEVNRLEADRLSTIYFCSSGVSVSNLKNEGVENGGTFRVYDTGDVMVDMLLRNSLNAEESSRVLEREKLKEKEYYLLTIHRASNTDNAEKLRDLLGAVSGLGALVVFPAHPRTVKAMKANSLEVNGKKIRMIEPVSYLDMLKLEKHAKKILTDSGGVQKEAYCFRVPCITLRENTEWVETVRDGWNVLAGTDREKIMEAAGVPESVFSGKQHGNLYGNGHASEKIAEILKGL